jgi:hypothetical protein
MGWKGVTGWEQGRRKKEEALRNEEELREGMRKRGR